MDLLAEIGQARKIAIAGHVRPDGDAVSSCLATRNYLLNALPDAQITVYLQVLPSIFSYMKGFSLINESYESASPYDLFISLDSADKSRLGDAAAIFDEAKKTICIDHHESNNGYADVNHIMGKASSTCEVLFDLFDKQYIDDEVAMDLYTGIVHDSGVFQYNNMSRHTFEIVGCLNEYDFDGPEIIQKTFYEKTFAQNKVLGRALLDSRLCLDDKCIYSLVDKKIMEEYNVLPKHFEGIVNALQKTRGVYIALFFYEMEPEHYKLSLRGNVDINLATIAISFGGGGHNRAAGCEVTGSFEDALVKVLDKIKEQIDIYESNNK